MPGWTEYVEPYAEESRFWYSLWTSAGKPREGELFSIMKSKKSHYKYAVRKLKRCVDIVSNDKFLESLLKNDTDIFKEIKKLRKKKNSLSSQIDDKVEPKDIAEHFSQVYMNLFNNVKGDEKLNLIESEIKNKIDQSSYTEISDINENIVRSAVNALKPDKRDSVFNVTSDMYQNSSDIFIKHLTVILKESIVHGMLPRIVMLCSLVPLLKDNLGDITKSSNYRALAGGCLILKVLDLVILKVEGGKLFVN